MFSSKKSKSIFVDLNDHAITVARVFGAPGSFVVEELKSCSPTNKEAVESLLREMHPKRGGVGNYVPACCAVYPSSRLVRRASIDTKRVSESGYFDEAAAAQCRIAPDEYMLAVASAGSGLDLHGMPSEKDGVFAGMTITDISSQQKKLLNFGIFPEILELGTLSMLGALINYLSFSKSATPTLVLEIGETSTQSFVLGDGGLATSRPIPQGIEAMVPIVQKELGLKDEESARRLFHSNTFDFTGMAAAFTKKLIKELQSSIGFYEVQTGQSIGQVICTLLPGKLDWMQAAIASQLGVEPLKIDYIAWLKARGVTVRDNVAPQVDNNNLGLLSLLIRV
jgi:hypothetical protein